MITRPINLFCGYDPREALGYHVFAHSVINRATRPVSLVPLHANGLQQGSNEFTVSRFLVPYLTGFRGHAIFADGADMLCLGDLAYLDAMFDSRFAVQVVPHQYKTRHPRKYVGTTMEAPNRDYPRKNWASLMLVNCWHPAWAWATPDALAGTAVGDLMELRFLRPKDIGFLPVQWNRLVDEGQPADDALLMHWTAGLPAFAAYRQAPGAERWHAAYNDMLQAVP